MKYLSTLIFILLFSASIFSQSLSSDRIARIKSATVRVIGEGGISIGTGVFVNKDGLLITCAHVVFPAFQKGKRIYIEFNNKDTVGVGLPDIFVNDTMFFRKAIAYDFCILSPLRPITTKFSVLKFGDFESAAEGDDIYTCGYPLGSPLQFISRGMISTKYINEINSVQQLGKIYRFPRKEALLDITLNKGNSGGAIVKVGRTIDEDVVIGLADFGLSPMGNKADSLIQSLGNSRAFIEFRTFDSSGKTISKQNPNEIAILFAQALDNTSIGVSGCIAINYLYDYLKR